jgi:hypothetical protein
MVALQRKQQEPNRTESDTAALTGGVSAATWCEGPSDFIGSKDDVQADDARVVRRNGDHGVRHARGRRQKKAPKSGVCSPRSGPRRRRDLER